MRKKKEPAPLPAHDARHTSTRASCATPPLHLRLRRRTSAPASSRPCAVAPLHLCHRTSPPSPVVPTSVSLSRRLIDCRVSSRFPLHPI
ncbi:hypothetical protein U1Q18_001031 [Sarracenia purpurea var. burkii]